MDLSVIIPARNEEFLAKTINCVMDKSEAQTEIIAILDGYWPDPPIIDRDNVTLIHHVKSIGQRAAVNEGVRLSQAKYIIKLDAHCDVDQGFDKKLIKNCEYDWTVIPGMWNLHGFDWECKQCGNRTYQGPYPTSCSECDNKGEFQKQIVWKRRKNRLTEFWMFDNNLKFQYWHAYRKRPEAKGIIVDVMSSIGACFFMHRERYLELEGLDENHGGWGQVGTEIACKSWLSGGRHVVNRGTWFAHMFRTQNGFKFPYPLTHKEQKIAEKYSRNLWLKNNWHKQKRELQWLVNKFSPVPSWEGGQLNFEKKPTLSVIIPARNEKYLNATIADIKKNFTSDYEIIVGLDNYEPTEKIDDDVKVYRAPKRVGMRSLINTMVSMASGKYIMKTDAHCSFDKGYDQKLISICNRGNTVLGIRYELDVDKWEKKERTNCDFRYLSNPDVDSLGGLRGLPWHEWKKVTKGQKIAESMSLSGSGWLMEKAQFDWWGGLDENHGTMYQEGAEIACKTWLSGGRLLINRDTWYAHHNRGKAPYALSAKQRQKSIDYSIELWMNNKWPLQKYSFNWLLDKFKPPGWEAPNPTTIKGIRQGTILKGIRKLEINYLWKHRIGLSEPLKRYRLEIFFDAFLQFLKDKNLETSSRYYQYLISHLSKGVQYNVGENSHNRTIRKMQRGINLLKDIKQNGLKAPLEFYQKDGKLILFRGYRRLAILKHLGVEYVAARVHKTEHIAKNYAEPFRIKKGSINELGAKQFTELNGNATDKYYVHNYLQIYDKLFEGLRNKPIKILELGLLRGASLRLWHEAFPKAQIYGLDKNETSWKKYTDGLDRIKVFVGMQEDEGLIKEVIRYGKFDIVIDDCGHNPDLQLQTFNRLWDSVNSKGFYIIEDCYRSFLEDTGANVPLKLASKIRSIYDSSVSSIQFYYNLSVIQK